MEQPEAASGAGLDGNSRIYRILFFLAAVAGVCYLCLKIMGPFLSAIAWAAVLSIAFRTPWNYLAGRMPRRRSLAAALMTLSIALIVLLPASLFIGLLTAQAVDVAAQVANRLQTEHISSFSDLSTLPEVTRVLDSINTRFGISREDFERTVSGLTARASSILASLSGKLVLSIFDAILTFVITSFLLFFFFRDGEAIAAAAINLVPTDADGRQRMSRSLGSMITAIFRGSMLCALAQGITGGIGWWIAGLPSPALAGAATAVLSLVPLGGTALVWLPGTIWLFYSGHHGSGIFFLIWSIVVTSFLADNVLRPMLIGGTEELSTLVVFLGVFGGLSAFGLLGIFIGPITLAMAISLLEVMRRHAVQLTVLSSD